MSINCLSHENVAVKCFFLVCVVSPGNLPCFVHILFIFWNLCYQIIYRTMFLFIKFSCVVAIKAQNLVILCNGLMWCSSESSWDLLEMMGKDLPSLESDILLQDQPSLGTTEAWSHFFLREKFDILPFLVDHKGFLCVGVFTLTIISMAPC